jgi:hypothetical protein
VSFAVSLRGCLLENGVAIQEPNVTRKKIGLTYSTSGSRAIFLELVLQCGERLGGPPVKSSLQTFTHKIVIYVPKQCLLDGRVTGPRTASS